MKVPTVITTRTVNDASPAGSGTSCGLRGVCRAWRVPGACARCSRNPLARTSGRGTAVLERHLAVIEKEHASVVDLRDYASRRMEAMNGQPNPVAAPRGAASCTSLNWRVDHELPNRTRFRLVGGRGRRAAGAVERAAEAVAGVRRARFNEETGSLLVLHDGADSTRRELRRALELVRLDDATADTWDRAGALDPSREARNEAVKAAVLSLVGAALPPGPRAALKIVQTLSALRAARPQAR